MTETAITASSMVTVSLYMSLAWAVIIKTILCEWYSSNFLSSPPQFIYVLRTTSFTITIKEINLLQNVKQITLPLEENKTMCQSTKPKPHKNDFKTTLISWSDQIRVQISIQSRICGWNWKRLFTHHSHAYWQTLRSTQTQGSNCFQRHIPTNNWLWRGWILQTDILHITFYYLFAI